MGFAFFEYSGPIPILIKKPTNDEECRQILKEGCGRTEEQIDAIFAYAKLAKKLKRSIKKVVIR